MGLDIGVKRIGVALSDEVLFIAQPYKVVERVSLSKDVDEILRICEAESVSLIVAGLPYSAEGTVGAQADKTLKFVEALRKKTGIKIITWDERFSTSAVERTLIEADASRQKRKKVVDKLAAAFILQGYLDSRETGQ